MIPSQLEPFEPGPDERILWQERRPRPLVSFLRSPGGFSTLLIVLTAGLHLEAPGPLVLGADLLLAGVQALLAVVLLGMLAFGYLRHANSEVVLTGRRVLLREPGRTRQIAWSAVSDVQFGHDRLILQSKEPVDDEVVGKTSWFVEQNQPLESYLRLVCPIRNPERVWQDLRADEVIGLDLVPLPRREPPPLREALLGLCAAAALLGMAAYIMDGLATPLGVWSSVGLGLPLVLLSLWPLKSALQGLVTRWVQPEDPGITQPDA